MLKMVLIPLIPGIAMVTALVILHLRHIRTGSKLKLIKTQVNHDLRSPLNAILGFADLLLQTEQDEEKKKFLTGIKSGGETLLSTLEELSIQINTVKDEGGKRTGQVYNHESILKSSNSLENEREALILIVDDMVENIVFLENILQKSGFRTLAATSGEDALTLLKNQTPDLILLDIIMPGMSGFDTCARIQSVQDFLDIPVIFLSAKKDEKTIIESFIYGGIDYIVKPFNSPELLARVNTHLQLKSAKEKLHKMAFSDPLTGLFNRRKFMEVLDHEMARSKRYNQDLSFMMLDIDHFKLINDNFGHDTGDEALKRFAGILKSSLRETDAAGRLGGEEFGVLLPQTSSEQALIVAERILSRTEKESGDRTLKIPEFTVSIGLSQLDQEKNDASLLTKDADRALYAAKTGGRNTVRTS